MHRRRNRVFAAMSGGVDSSTAAALMLRQGYEVSGVFMITCGPDETTHTEADAKRVAEALGIKLYVVDMREDFRKVLDYFVSEYARGRTPNPCVFCNRFIKFGRLFRFAMENGADYFCTGHYVRVIKSGDSVGLFAAECAKDQSYALAMLDRKILDSLLLPMGVHTKEQTRRLSREFGLDCDGRKESQDICFIPDGDYAGLLERLRPQIIKDGNIVDSSGKVLGKHHGIYHYTIGQRRGLGVAMGEPYYVVGLDAETNTVILGPREELMHKKLIAAGANWLIDAPGEPFESVVKIRYNAPGTPATVHRRGDKIEVEFASKVSAITPGQLAVFYIDSEAGRQVAGGAWIENWDG